jgi:hypothetical protein
MIVIAATTMLVVKTGNDKRVVTKATMILPMIVVTLEHKRIEEVKAQGNDKKKMFSISQM